jgi:hypothetical protein
VLVLSTQFLLSGLPRFTSKKVLADPAVAPPAPTHKESIKQLIEIVDSVPQLEIPVTHYFSPGIYAREITMPAGMTGVGHIHKHRHLNIALTGHALVTWDGQTQEIRAPFIFESLPGAQKAFQVFEDLRWITIHANPTEIRDIVEMEREIFDMPQEMIEAAIPVDEYRMTKRSLCQA